MKSISFDAILTCVTLCILRSSASMIVAKFDKNGNMLYVYISRRNDTEIFSGNISLVKYDNCKSKINISFKEGMYHKKISGDLSCMNLQFVNVTGNKTHHFLLLNIKMWPLDKDTKINFTYPNHSDILSPIYLQRKNGLFLSSSLNLDKLKIRAKCFKNSSGVIMEFKKNSHLWISFELSVNNGYQINLTPIRKRSCPEVQFINGTISGEEMQMIFRILLVPSQFNFSIEFIRSKLVIGRTSITAATQDSSPLAVADVNVSNNSLLLQFYYPWDYPFTVTIAFVKSQIVCYNNTYNQTDGRKWREGLFPSAVNEDIYLKFSSGSGSGSGAAAAANNENNIKLIYFINDTLLSLLKRSDMVADDMLVTIANKCGDIAKKKLTISATKGGSVLEAKVISRFPDKVLLVTWSPPAIKFGPTLQYNVILTRNNICLLYWNVSCSTCNGQIVRNKTDSITRIAECNITQVMFYNLTTASIELDMINATKLEPNKNYTVKIQPINKWGSGENTVIHFVSGVPADIALNNQIRIVSDTYSRRERQILLFLPLSGFREIYNYITNFTVVIASISSIIRKKDYIFDKGNNNRSFYDKSYDQCQLEGAHNCTFEISLNMKMNRYVNINDNTIKLGNMLHCDEGLQNKYLCRGKLQPGTKYKISLRIYYNKGFNTLPYVVAVPKNVPPDLTVTNAFTIFIPLLLIETLLIVVIYFTISRFRKRRSTAQSLPPYSVKYDNSVMHYELVDDEAVYDQID